MFKWHFWSQFKFVKCLNIAFRVRLILESHTRVIRQLYYYGFAFNIRWYARIGAHIKIRIHYISSSAEYKTCSRLKRNSDRIWLTKPSGTTTPLINSITLNNFVTTLLIFITLDTLSRWRACGLYRFCIID